jgi:hypothetical protein
MKIILQMTRAELRETGLSKDRLKAAVFQQLDDATLPSGKTAVDLPGYDIEIEITEG